MLILNLSFLMYLFFSQKVLSQISSEFVYAVTPLEQDLLIAGNTRVRVASGFSRRPQRSHAHHLHAKSPSLHLCLAFLSSSQQVKWAQICSCRRCTIMWYRHTEGNWNSCDYNNKQVKQVVSREQWTVERNRELTEVYEKRNRTWQTLCLIFNPIMSILQLLWGISLIYDHVLLV